MRMLCRSEDFGLCATALQLYSVVKQCPDGLGALLNNRVQLQSSGTAIPWDADPESKLRQSTSSGRLLQTRSVRGANNDYDNDYL